MDALKRFSLALMAALVVVGATPAFSQTRDTRPTEPDRPNVESGDSGGSSESAPADEPRLHKSTAGIGCLVKDLHGSPAVLAVNGTGTVIPAGSVVTLYIQPGSIEKLFKLDTDWQPGQSISVPLKLAQFPEGAECAVRLSDGNGANAPGESSEEQLPAAGPDAGSTKDAPSDDGSALPEGPMPDLPTGEGDPDGGLIPQGFVDVVNQPSFTCQVWVKRDGVWVYFTNTTGESLPPGTKVTVKMPDGSTLEYTLQATYVPGGKFGVKLDEMPKDWDCSPEVTLP